MNTEQKEHKKSLKKFVDDSRELDLKKFIEAGGKEEDYDNGRGWTGELLRKSEEISKEKEETAGVIGNIMGRFPNG